MAKKKIDFFEKTVYDFCSLLKVKKPVIVKPNKRIIHYTAEVKIIKNKFNTKKDYIISYNPKNISTLSYWKIGYVILHELGHIKTINTAKNLFENEYRAEKFAYKAIKKHFKLQLLRYLDYIAWYELTHQDIYQRVFRKLLKEIMK